MFLKTTYDQVHQAEFFLIKPLFKLDLNVTFKSAVAYAARL